MWLNNKFSFKIFLIILLNKFIAVRGLKQGLRYMLSAQ